MEQLEAAELWGEEESAAMWRSIAQQRHQTAELWRRVAEGWRCYAEGDDERPWILGELRDCRMAHDTAEAIDGIEMEAIDSRLLNARIRHAAGGPRPRPRTLSS
jgi:hypothetical protein